MKKFTSPLTFSILRRLKKPFALIILFSCILSTNLISQSARLDQWQKLDVAWEYGNLNRKHSNYVEGETVPYRIFMSGLTAGTQVNFIIEFDITAPNPSPVKHGIDYLRTYNATIGDPPFNDATVLGDVPAGFSVPATTDIKAIPAPLNLSFLSGLSQGDMILKGGTIDNISYDDEGDPTSAHGKARVKVDFTPDGPFAVLLFGGHLSREQDYDGNGDLDFTNDDDGAGGIHGAPYHMRLESITGHQDRSVMVGLPNCPVVDDCFDDLYKCEQLLNGTGTTPAAYFDLTGSSCDVPDDQWYKDADFTDPITDPETFLGHEGDIVYGKLSNDCGNSTAYLTLHVYSLPTINPLSDFSVCINALKFLLIAGGSDVGTFSGDGVTDGYFDPEEAGVGEHIITFTITNANLCSINRTFKITVTSLTTVTCPSNKEVCISDAPFLLTNALPINGIYSGDGVSLLGIFTPVDAGLGSHTITYTYSDGNSCINTCSFTITVNPLPTFGTITPTSTCSGTSNGTITLASCQAGVSYQLQTCSGYNRQDPKTCSNGIVTWIGLASGSYKIVATITATGCSKTSDCVTVVGAVCNNTLTQGFYGNLGGKDCNGKAALDIMKPAIGVGNSVKFGNQAADAAGCKSFTLKYTDLTTSDGNKLKIFRMLPGGTTPSVLGCSPASCSYTAYYDCAASWPFVTIQASGSAKGSLNNVLLAQTMTLFFNLYNSASLGGVQLTGNKLTFNNLACGSSTPGTYASTQYIPCSVLNYLSNPANYASPSIANLYNLANKVLGGIVTTISASDMNAALNAINVGFDKGKALMSQEITCAVPVTRTSSQIVNEVVAPNPVVTAYPNPFNDQVRFILQSTEPGKATLDVYNMVGQKVKTVFQGQLFANSPQTVEYKVPAHSPSENLIYIFRINGKQFTGKLINIRN